MHASRLETTWIALGILSATLIVAPGCLSSGPKYIEPQLPPGEAATLVVQGLTLDRIDGLPVAGYSPHTLSPGVHRIAIAQDNAHYNVRYEFQRGHDYRLEMTDDFYSDAPCVRDLTAHTATAISFAPWDSHRRHYKEPDLPPDQIATLQAIVGHRIVSVDGAPVDNAGIPFVFGGNQVRVQGGSHLLEIERTAAKVTIEFVIHHTFAGGRRYTIGDDELGNVAVTDTTTYSSTTMPVR